MSEIDEGVGLESVLTVPAREHHGQWGGEPQLCSDLEVPPDGEGV